MRYENGVPREISDLSPEPGLNRPWGGDTSDLCVLLEFIRALSAFIAQQEVRIKTLEAKILTGGIDNG